MLQLHLISGFGPRSFLQLREKYGGDLGQMAADQRVHELIATCDVAELEYVAGGYDFVCWGEDLYPRMLQQIHDPPLVLFWLGNVELLNRASVAMVGTRSYSNYGADVARTVAEALTAAGQVVVSGMALGIDAIAHQRVLAADGATVAVLASAVDRPTPAANYQLYSQILEKDGLIVSEQIPGRQLHKQQFASRNRLISGMAQTTVVIEAGERSGSLITARCAFDQNREVFAVPGSIFNQRSAGTHKLIAEQIATPLYDIRRQLGSVSDIDFSALAAQLTEAELLVVQQLAGGWISADQLGQNLPQLDASAILSLLSKLELAGVVESRSGEYGLVR